MLERTEIDSIRVVESGRAPAQLRTEDTTGPAGLRLRRIRDWLGLTMRDVEGASLRLAERYASQEYWIPPSRLSDIETKAIVPSIFRLYSLAVIYRKPMRELLQLYGIDLGRAGADWAASRPANSHIAACDDECDTPQTSLNLDNADFDSRATAYLGQSAQRGGPLPFSFLSELPSRKYTYAFVGSEDMTMFPILPPGSFVQVDASKNKVADRPWRSEYERPIYLVETREGYTCCWCSQGPNTLILQSHPLSPAPVRVLKHPQEAEVIGQVVGVASRFGN